MKRRAVRTASKRGGRAQEAEFDTAEESVRGSPRQTGESTVDPSVPIRGTPAIVDVTCTCALHGSQCAGRMQGQMHVHVEDLGAQRRVGEQIFLRPLQ
ncbi:hypothetical protein GCM10010357_02890 [Streptomyces luteireticuli]|uniref:SWIM-type domain-containing protein n=1 Tax=Streptomyces luteireticuli TaxID=173858 RepID=A0ABP3HZB4_9ACTN